LKNSKTQYEGRVVLDLQELKKHAEVHAALAYANKESAVKYLKDGFKVLDIIEAQDDSYRVFALASMSANSEHSRDLFWLIDNGWYEKMSPQIMVLLESVKYARKYIDSEYADVNEEVLECLTAEKILQFRNCREISLAQKWFVRLGLESHVDEIYDKLEKLCPTK
jgi:hypothetical protein